MSSCCGGCRRNADVDPSATGDLAFHHDKIPSFAELKTKLKADPSLESLTYNGAKLENGTARKMVAGGKPMVIATFASSPIKDSDRPFRIEVLPPFKGQIEGFHIGDGSEQWNKAAQTSAACSSLVGLGAGGELVTGNRRYATLVICDPVPHMPAGARPFGSYETGASFDSSINGLVIDNFLVRVSSKDGRAYFYGGDSSDAAAQLLLRMWGDLQSSNDPVRIAVGFFSKPGLDLSLMYSMPEARSAVKIMCGSLTRADSQSTLSFYGEFASGLQQLDHSKFWGANASGDVVKASESLQVYAREYGLSVQTMRDSCRSLSFGGMKSAQLHAARAREARSNFLNSMQGMELHIEEVDDGLTN